MRKTIIKAAALGLAAGLALTACSDPGAAPAPGGTTSPDAPPAADFWPAQDTKLEGTKLTIWAAQNSTKTGESVIAEFEKLTGAEIDVVTIPDPYEQGIQTKVATGDKPDLAFWQPTESMLSAINAKTNLQVLADAPWLESFEPNLRDITGLMGQDRYAALITTPAVQGVYYNKEVLAANGVTELPKNFDELIQIGRALKAKGVTPFFEMGADRWATQWWVQVQLADAAKDGLWDRINTNQEKFTDETVLATIKNYKGWIDEGLFNDSIKTATFEDQGDALLNGDAAFVVQVNSFFGQLQAKADTATLDEKIGFFPISPTGNVGTFIPDQGNALIAFKTGDAAREAAARQLLSFWLGDGYEGFVTSNNTIPLKPSVAMPAGVPQALQDVHNSLGDSVGSMQALAVANPDLYIFLADMIQGTKTPEEVAQATQDPFAQLAKALGAEGF
jgi:raffinose/stachyose/melibiose transport system substrate-binding protein